MSVMPWADATSIANVEADAIEATIGIPARLARSMTSGDVRPVEKRMRSANGRSPARSARPTSLSTALRRPTSSA